MKIRAVMAAAILAVSSSTTAFAEQPAASADGEKPATATAAEEKAKADKDALLRAQAAGYKLVNKDGKEVFCKKELVTGSRLATRTRCLTLAQLEEQRNANKDMLMDVNRRSVNRPDE